MSFQSILADTAAFPGRGGRRLSWFAVPLSGIRARLRQTADTLYAARELEALTDRELADIGLNRGEIRRAVRSGRT